MQGTVPSIELPSGRRRVLPVTRRSVTHKFAVAGFEGYLTVGLFEDDSPGEVFIKMSKEGSTLSGLIQGRTSSVWRSSDPRCSR